MPAKVKRPRTGRKCPCGCGQAPAETMRQRKCVCLWCGFNARTTREWLAQVGAPCCPKHGPMDVPCTFDAAHLPGDLGAAALHHVRSNPSRYGGEVDFTASAKARKAARTRKRHRAFAAAGPDLPF